MKGWMRKIKKIRNTSSTGQWAAKQQYIEYSQGRTILLDLANAGLDIWLIENGTKLKMTVTDGEVTTGFIFDLRRKGDNYWMDGERNQ